MSIMINNDIFDLSYFYPYYSVRFLDGIWKPVSSYDGTNWIATFDSQANEDKETVLAWLRSQGANVVL